MKMILNKFRNCIKENKGFVLVDSMVAVLILAIGLAALALLYTGGIGTMHKGNTREKVVQIAADRIEVLKALDGKDSYSALQTFVTNELNSNTNKNVTTTTDAEQFTVSGTLGEALSDAKTGRTGDDYVVPVTVTVTWKSPETQTCTLVTYVTVTGS